MRSLQMPDHIFITDRHTTDPFMICQKLPAGGLVILRDYDMAEKEREELAYSLQKLCRKLGLFFLVAKTPALARKIKADGVHLPEFMTRQAFALRQKNPDWLITAAAHTRLAAHQAAIAGADAVLISPVFPTKSHPGAKNLGIHRAKKIVSPYIYNYALGGVLPAHLKLLKSIKFQGVASVSGY